MRMVVLFAGGAFQGPAPGHGKFIRAEQRIKIGTGRVHIMVLGKETAVDFHTEFAGGPRNSHALGLIVARGRAPACQKSDGQPIEDGSAFHLMSFCWRA